MKIVFLNTWHSELHDELRAYVRQSRDTTAVYCFQEANELERRAYEDLLLDEFEHHCATKDPGIEGVWYGNSIYVRKGFTVTDTGSLFSDKANDNGAGLAAYVTLKTGDTQLTICNVHGVPYPGNKLDDPSRLYQSQALLRAFADHESVVIGGDFNLLPHTKSVQSFAEQGYKNLITDFNIPTTRNHIVFDKFPDNIQYYADYAFVSPNITVEGFEVPSLIVSDHQPLELQLSITENQGMLVPANSVSVGA